MIPTLSLPSRLAAPPELILEIKTPSSVRSRGLPWWALIPPLICIPSFSPSVFTILRSYDRRTHHSEKYNCVNISVGSSKIGFGCNLMSCIMLFMRFSNDTGLKKFMIQELTPPWQTCTANMEHITPHAEHLKKKQQVRTRYSFIYALLGFPRKWASIKNAQINMIYQQEIVE